MPHFEYQHQRLFYREQGRGDPLLILHGNTASSALHQGELDTYQSRYRAVALDALGCGQSARLETWPDEWWRDYAHQAAALINHLNAGPAIVMGTSGGAIAALWVAALYPALCHAVIADSLVQHHLPERLRHEVLVNRAERNPAQIAFWHAAHGEDWAQVVEADNQVLLALAARGGAMLAGCPLEAIRCPVLITVSRADTLLPNVIHEATTLSQMLQSSRLYVHDTGDHPLMWSQPTAFRGVVDVFLHHLA